MLKKHRSVIAVAFIAFIAFAAIAVHSDAALSADRSISIPMKALNGSRENGAAAFTQLPNGVRVVVTLPNAPLTGQPTHIHAGSCAAPKPAPLFALRNTANGKSVSFIPGVRLDALRGDVVLVHQSLRNLGVYVACGTIR